MFLIKQSIKKIFQWQAKLVLKKYKPKVIAITGSVGKTQTRDVLYSLLSKKFFIRKSQKSFTTELGVPLTIIGCEYGRGTILDWFKNILIGLRLVIYKTHYPKWLILEIDGDKPGDIEKISKWVNPNILIVTAIGEVPSHIEAFGSNMDSFLREKKLFLNSVSKDGVIFYNTDDIVARELVANSDLEKVSCGLNKDSKISGTPYEVLIATTNGLKIPTGMFFVANIGGENLLINVMESIGVSNEYAVLLAFAVANHLGLNSKELSSITNKVPISAGHMKIIQGIKDVTILDDSYNSSPIALIQAIESLSKIEKDGRKIAVLGDMLELGRFSSEEHKKIGNLLKDVADICVFVGLRVKKIEEEILSLGFIESNIHNFNSSYEAGNFLQNFVEAGDIVLVKGSQDMRMERVVEEIMRHPEDKLRLLVRQSEEWLER